MDKASDMTVTIKDGRDKTIRELQTSLPWTIRYSRDFRANPQPHKDFTHALLHVSKALGKLMGLADDMDRDREKADRPQLREEYGKYVADLVVCALRAANTFPGGVLDLQTATEERITQKNSVTQATMWVPQEPFPTNLKREPIRDERRIAPDYGSHKFRIVEAMKDDTLLGCVPVVENWHNAQAMEAVEAVYPEATGFRDRDTPLFVAHRAEPRSLFDGPIPEVKGAIREDPLMKANRDAAVESGSLHWEAVDADGKHLGTFWAPRNRVSIVGQNHYPQMARAKRTNVT